jgi:hypothetical protein
MQFDCRDPMKDQLGNELCIGDIVYFSHNEYNYFYGKIEGFIIQNGVSKANICIIKNRRYNPLDSTYCSYIIYKSNSPFTKLIED